MAALIAFNSVMLCLQALGVGGVDGGSLIASYGLIPSRFMRWVALGGDALDPRRYVPLATSMFLHDGWVHLVTNMVYLWVFGRALEERLGRVGLAATFVLSGVAAALGQVIAHPHSNAAMIGASGAIAGLLGAYLVCFPRAKVTIAFPFLLLPWVIKVRAAWFLLAWFALQVGRGTADLLAATNDPQVAWWAHATGFVAGLVGALAGRAWLPTDAPATAPAQHPGASPAAPRASRVPVRPSRVPVPVGARPSLVPAGVRPSLVTAGARASLGPSVMRASVVPSGVRASLAPSSVRASGVRVSSVPQPPAVAG